MGKIRQLPISRRPRAKIEVHKEARTKNRGKQKSADIPNPWRRA